LETITKWFLEYLDSPKTNPFKKILLFASIILSIIFIDNYFAYSDLYVSKNKAETVNALSEILNNPNLSPENRKNLLLDFNRIAATESYGMKFKLMVENLFSNKVIFSAHPIHRPSNSFWTTEFFNPFLKISLHIISSGLLFWFALVFELLSRPQTEEKKREKNLKLKLFAALALSCSLIFFVIPPYYSSLIDILFKNIISNLAVTSTLTILAIIVMKKGSK
jgi:hypothetical protein